MKMSEHVEALQKRFKDMTEEQATETIQSATLQILNQQGDDWTDEYLATLLDKTGPDMVALGVTPAQFLSTVQGIYVMFSSIGVVATGKGFALGVDKIISDASKRAKDLAKAAK